MLLLCLPLSATWSTLCMTSSSMVALTTSPPSLPVHAALRCTESASARAGPAFHVEVAMAAVGDVRPVRGRVRVDAQAARHGHVTTEIPPVERERRMGDSGCSSMCYYCWTIQYNTRRGWNSTIRVMQSSLLQSRSFPLNNANHGRGHSCRQQQRLRLVDAVVAVCYHGGCGATQLVALSDKS
jgi:hypothetical protein